MPEVGCPSRDRHDTAKAYRRDGCRCTAAREAENARKRRYLTTPAAKARRAEQARAARRYVDHAAVRQACDGAAVRLTRRERRAAVVLLTKRGEAARQIAERLRVCTDTVYRHRVAARREGELR
jgi:DNA-binding NarL/FixJ family response regulator